MSDTLTFAELGLPASLLATLQSVGYEQPSPIQEKTIPPLLAKRDVLGQAQTGTGKTAAFALPILANLDATRNMPQALILTPTRELAIQVAEAFQTYARGIEGFQVLPVYGGQAYDVQLRQLRRGCHVIVGTPGRLMDHMRRKTLDLSALRTLVLDEADEMLRMGFQEDVEWILQHLPADRQTALFSATMPREIRQVADQHMRDPVTVQIESATRTADKIRQRYWAVRGLQKLDALTRILETESFDGMIVFVRTRTATIELAEKLSARGFAAEAMNGEMAQNQREALVDRLRRGKLDILVATDVVARGLDVERVSHVVNYDIPYDTEAYIHRIGRTGRAGRTGDAILFVAPRERRMLALIERATRKKIEAMRMPSVNEVNESRIERFRSKVVQAAENAGQLEFYEDLITSLSEESGLDTVRLAAALARMIQGDKPMLLDPAEDARLSRDVEDFGDSREASARESRPRRGPEAAKQPPELNARSLKAFPDIAMQRYVIRAGYQDGLKPSHIVGAIANEADLESKFIGHIEIFDQFAIVDLPAGMPEEVETHLSKTRFGSKISGLHRLTSTGQLPEITTGGSSPSRPARNPRATRDRGRSAGSSRRSEQGADRPPKRRESGPRSAGRGGEADGRPAAAGGNHHADGQGDAARPRAPRRVQRKD